MALARTVTVVVEVGVPPQIKVVVRARDVLPKHR
jgi:hypothetical protein